MVPPLCSSRATESNIRYRDITPGKQEPSLSSTEAADWTSFVFLPTRQAALMVASSEARLNLASRIWQEDTSRVGRKQPKDEYTSALPNQDDCCFRKETAKFVAFFLIGQVIFFGNNEHTIINKSCSQRCFCRFNDPSPRRNRQGLTSQK